MPLLVYLLLLISIGATQAALAYALWLTGLTDDAVSLLRQDAKRLARVLLPPQMALVAKPVYHPRLQWVAGRSAQAFRRRTAE